MADILEQQLKKRVELALQHDARIQAGEVAVDIDEDQVHLSGHVPIYHGRRAATETAASVSGVQSVKNRIRVRTPHIPDTELKRRIDSVYRYHSAINESDITVKTKQGRVVLEGSVDAMWEKKLAEELAWSMTGVSSVFNSISISGSKQSEDKAIQKIIEEQLDRMDLHNRLEVTIEVHNNVATLTGYAHSEFAKQALISLLDTISGIEGYIDRMSIKEAPATISG